MIRSRKDDSTTATLSSSITAGVSPTIISTKHDLNKSTTIVGSNSSNNITGNNSCTNVNTPTTGGVSSQSSPAAFRFQQQRTLSNVGPSVSSKGTSSSLSSSIAITTPIAKRTMSNAASSSFAFGNSCRDDSTSQSKSQAPSATAVSSFAAVKSSSSSSSSSSSLQYYNNLLQHQMYNIRKNRFKKKSKHHNSSNSNNSSTDGATGGSSIWTVQIPKRMLYSTMSIFLLIPMLGFVYKEMHLQSMDSKGLRSGNPYNGQSLPQGMTLAMRQANRNQEYVTWLTKEFANEEDDDGDGSNREESDPSLSAAAGVAADAKLRNDNETIHALNHRNKGNKNNNNNTFPTEDDSIRQHDEEKDANNYNADDEMSREEDQQEMQVDIHDEHKQPEDSENVETR